MSALDRTAVRAMILSVVRDMAKAYPGAEYCSAREAFGLLGKIKVICKNSWPTARQCWESVGLHRSQLVGEFEFKQAEVK